jgi:hypothetical protein
MCVLTGICIPNFGHFPLGHAVFIFFFIVLALIFFAVWWEDAACVWVICPNDVIYTVRPSGRLLRGSGARRFGIGTEVELKLSRRKESGVVEIRFRFLSGSRRTRRIGYRRVVRQPLPAWMNRYYSDSSASEGG